MNRAAPLSQSIARAARRRAMIADSIRLAPIYLAGSAIAAGALIASCRYFHVPMQWWAVTAGAAAIATLGISLHAALNRWSLRHAAAVVDNALKLNDRIGIALELSTTIKNDPGFVALAIDAGEAAAKQADVSSTIPVKWKSWWWLPSLASIGLAAAAWWYVPAQATAQVTKSEAAKVLQEAKQVATASDPASPLPQQQPELSELEQIEKELAQGKATPSDAATRAASVLERAADQRTKDSQAEKSQADQARDALARAANKPARDEAPADASAIRKALQSGDLDKAAEEAQKLAENADRLSPEERSALQRDLRDLAEALDQQAREDTAAAAGATKPDSEESHPKDLTQEKPQDSADPAADSSQDPKLQSDAQKLADAARSAAEELKQPAKDTQARSADAKNSPADQKEAKPNPSDASEPKKNDERKSGEKPSNDSTEKSGDQSADKTPEKSGEKPGEKTGDKSSGKSGDKTGEKSGEKQGDKSNPDGTQPESKSASEKKPSATGQKTGDTSKQVQGKPSDGAQTSPSGEKEQKGDAKGDAESGEKQSGSNQNQSRTQPANSGDKQQPQESKGTADRTGNQNPKNGSPEGTPQGTDSKSSEGKDQKPDAQSTKEGNQPAQGNASKEASQPPQGGSGLQKLAKELKDMQNKSKDAAKNERSSQQMREQARKILKDMDPQQRKELEKLAQGAGEGQGQGVGAGGQPQNSSDAQPTKPWSGASKVVDFRTKPGSAAAPGKERVISDWQKQTPDGQRAQSQAGSEMEDDIRQAREGAERAIEQQSVPAQHRDLVRRVFERFNNRARPDPAAPPAAAPDAKPAGSGGR